MKDKITRVGVFTHDFFPLVGGQGRHVYEMYKQNLNDKKLDQLIFSPSENDLKNHIRIFPETQKSKLKNIEFSYKLGRKIEDFISKYNLDIVHIHGGPGGLFLLKKLRVPTLYTCHHTYWQQSQYVEGEKWKVIFYFLERLGYKKADKIICVSKDTLAILSEEYEIEDNKLVYIPNGIDLKKYSPVIHKSVKYPELLYVGRIDKRKGVDFLVQSMKLINIQNPNIKLHIVGVGKDKNKLEQFSEENNLNIVFHGKLSDDDLNNLYSKISIQIAPSIFEGFGITVLEGMAKKVPVIGTNVHGIREIISDKESGLLIDSNDKESLKKSVDYLLSNPALMKKISNHAYNKLNNYNWELIYKNTLHEYATTTK